MDWLKSLANNFLAESRPGWLVVDAEHENCGSPGAFSRWLGVVHRDTMGHLQCPECGEMDGCTVRVYDSQKKIHRRWPGIDPITHNADGTIKEGK